MVAHTNRFDSHLDSTTVEFTSDFIIITAFYSFISIWGVKVRGKIEKPKVAIDFAYVFFFDKH